MNSVSSVFRDDLETFIAKADKYWQDGDVSALLDIEDELLEQSRPLIREAAKLDTAIMVMEDDEEDCYSWSGLIEKRNEILRELAPYLMTAKQCWDRTTFLANLEEKHRKQ